LRRAPIPAHLARAHRLRPHVGLRPEIPVGVQEHTSRKALTGTKEPRRQGTKERRSEGTKEPRNEGAKEPRSEEARRGRCGGLPLPWSDVLRVVRVVSPPVPTRAWLAFALLCVV